MTARQPKGLVGGWRLNVFPTPDLRPFWGGTYFPPTSVHGRIGLLELLPRLASAWRDQRESLVAQGQQVLDLVARLATPERDAQPYAALADECAAFLAQRFDAHG